MFRLNPLTVRKLKRFKEIRRGYYSAILLVVLTGLSLFAELMVNDRAIIVSYEGQWFFPTYADVKLGATFGLTGTDALIPVDYRALQARFEGTDNWTLMPMVPWGPYFNDTVDGVLKAQPPNFDRGHYLGTDSTGRDVLSRLVYGFRTAIFFAIAFTALTYIIGVSIGCAMGYFGGVFDLLFQRIIEIWSNIPFLYMVIIVFSVIPATYEIGTRIAILLLIMVLFSWTGLTYYMRTETYKEKARDYTAAALVLGAGTSRVIFRHILPNTHSGQRHHRHHRVGLSRLGAAAAHAEHRRAPEAGHRQPDDRALDRHLRLRCAGLHTCRGHLHRRGRSRGLRPT
jgi:microcin C transport system permease protein